MSSRSCTRAGLALAAAALALAACPAVDFENHSFACATDLDCLYMDGEECADGHCRKITSACAKTSDCTSGKKCVVFSYGTRCVSSCALQSDCTTGRACKLVDEAGTSSLQYVTVCSVSGGGITNGACNRSDECVESDSCIVGACRLTCYPGQSTCAGVGEACKLGGPGLPESWGFCQ